MLPIKPEAYCNVVVMLVLNTSNYFFSFVVTKQYGNQLQEIQLFYCVLSLCFLFQILFQILWSGEEIYWHIDESINRIRKITYQVLVEVDGPVQRERKLLLCQMPYLWQSYSHTWRRSDSTVSNKLVFLLLAVYKCTVIQVPVFIFTQQ